MKKCAILVSGLGLAYGPCYEAYVFNTEYCNSDSTCNQRTVDRMYEECLRTGIVEYI